MILLNQQIDRVAAGRDDDIPFAFRQQMFIFCFNQRRADCCFFGGRKAQFFQGGLHGADADAVEICDKGRGDACDNRFVFRNQALRFFGIIDDLFCILWADNKALSAEDAFFRGYMRLIVRKADRLHRTMADAFIAVFAI